MAIEYAIQCMPEDDRQAPEVVRAIYRTFWCEGKDISDRQVLEQVGKRPMEAASSERARRVAQEWSTAWHATGHHGVPLIIDSDGGLLMGCVSPGQIEEYFYRKGG